MAQKISLATEFFGTLREVERAVNGRIDKMRKEDMDGIFLSATNIQVLDLILEFSYLSSPLEIAKEGQMVAGAFIRAIKSLEDNELVTLTEEDKKITAVSLTKYGREIAKICSKSLNSVAQELVQSDEAKAFARTVTKHTA